MAEHWVTEHLNAENEESRRIETVAQRKRKVLENVLVLLEDVKRRYCERHPDSLVVNKSASGTASLRKTEDGETISFDVDEANGYFVIEHDESSESIRIEFSLPLLRPDDVASLKVVDNTSSQTLSEIVESKLTPFLFDAVVRRIAKKRRTASFD